MVFRSLSPSALNLGFTNLCSSPYNKALISGNARTSYVVNRTKHRSIWLSNQSEPNKLKTEVMGIAKPSVSLCPCGRRHLLETRLLSEVRSSPENGSDYKETMNKVRPPRPDWYEQLIASFYATFTQPYELEIATYKSDLFTIMRGKAKTVLELGIGTGSNLKYYANDADVEVFGVDPNQKMLRYAQEAAEAAGLPPANFKFIQAVGEALPLSDASVDAVIGTLVLCSVADVDKTLQEVKRVLRPGGLYLFVEHVAAKDGTFLRFLQSLLNPLQWIIGDGCDLTRETGKKISEAGFSSVDLSTTFLSKAAYTNPQVYGIATK